MKLLPILNQKSYSFLEYISNLNMLLHNLKYKGKCKKKLPNPSLKIVILVSSLSIIILELNILFNFAE